MTHEIMTGLLEIIKQGGVYAIWGIGIWLLVSLVKVLAGLWTVYLITKLLVVGIMQYRAIKLERISLISTQVSDKLEQCLRDIAQKSSDLERACKNQSPASDIPSEKK